MRILRRLASNLWFVAAMLAFVAVVAGSTAYTILRLRAQAIDSSLEINAMYAHVFEDHLTQGFRFIDLILARSLADEDDLRPEKAQALLAGAVRRTPALRSLSLAEPGGVVFASSNPANVGVRVERDATVPPASGTGEFVRIGAPWAGRDFASGKPGEPGSVAAGSLGFIPVLRDAEIGKRRIVVVAAVNPDYFINNFVQKLGPADAVVDVVRYDGLPLFSTREPQGADAPQHRETIFSGRFPEIESGRFEETLGGTEMLTAFRASAIYPLVVVTHRTRASALAQWDGERRALLLVVVPALAVIIVLAAMLYARQRRIAIERREASRREHERLAATVFATVNQPVLVTDADNRIVEVNPAFTAVTGYTPEEVIGRNPSLLSSGRHPPEFFARMHAALAQTGSWQGELWNRHKDGHLYVEWLSIARLHDEKGVHTHNVAAFSDITDRKDAEEAQLRAVLEASPEAVLLVAPDGGIRFANRVSERTFGYPADELAGRAIDDLVPGRFREAHGHQRQDFMRSPHSRPMGAQLRLSALRRDGSEFPAEISLCPIRRGEETFVIAAVNDISRRIRDEEALRASEERWKFALEGAGEGVWDWNIATGHALFSQRMLDFWGCAEGSVEPRIEAWHRRVHADDAPRLMAELEAHLAGRTAGFAVEHRVRCEDGHWQWALARGMVSARDGDGRPQRMIGTYADISERKKIEEDFRDLLYFNQSVIANSHSGIMVHKATGECILANEAAAWIAGTTTEILLEHNFRRSPSWRESGELAAAEEALATGRTVEFESPMRTIYGKDIWCVASLGRLHIKGEHYLLSVFNDISARKQAEMEVIRAKERAEALLDRAHLAERRIIDISEETLQRIGGELHDDLGQHLTGVAFLSQVLFQQLQRQGSAETPAAAKITELINEAVSKTRQLAQGHYPVALEEAGLPALLDQIARNVESIYGIHCELVGESVEFGDFRTEINLFRIAQEAINNAIKHGGAKNIRLTLERGPEFFVFEIADDGCGMKTPDAAKMGGLGMHTMRYRAALIGAALEIRAGEPGGTRVIITLPMEKGAA